MRELRKVFSQSVIQNQLLSFLEFSIEYDDHASANIWWEAILYINASAQNKQIHNIIK